MRGAKLLCVSCGGENREGARFCSGCGEELGLACPSCGSKLSTTAAFCDSCGASLASAKRAATPPPAPSLPSSFAANRYTVRGFLGEGGRKRVYLAHDTKLDRDVAFALIKTEGLDSDGLARVRREAQAMGAAGRPSTDCHRLRYRRGDGPAVYRLAVHGRGRPGGSTR